MNGGPIKIGASTNVEQRLKILQTGNHNKLCILHKTSGGHTLESHLHEKYLASHILGDWFSETKEILADIEQYKDEDEIYGRVLSIVDFALDKGLSIPNDDRETLVILSKGGSLPYADYKTKEQYWRILDSYHIYQKKFPQSVIDRRLFNCFYVEGTTPDDMDYRKKHTIPLIR